MLIYYIILLIICIHAKAYDCIPSGDKFDGGFNDNFFTLCKTTNNDYSYHFTYNFTYSLTKPMECKSTYFSGTFTMTSSKDYWNAKTFYIQKHSQITLNGKFHTREEFNIGKNSKINWNGN
ncbi:protein kinase domain containing protein, partial [Entamoeba histolytica KU27]